MKNIDFVTREYLDKAFAQFDKDMSEIKRPGINNILDFVNDKEQSDFFIAPASSSVKTGVALKHLCCPNGLFLHSYHVRMFLLQLIGTYPEFEISRESAIITAWLHDFCKINLYHISMRNQKIDGVWKEVEFYDIEDEYPIQHGEKSVIHLQQLGLFLTKDETIAIANHMGFAGSGDFSKCKTVEKAFESSKLLLLLSFADQMAAAMFDWGENIKVLEG